MDRTVGTRLHSLFQLLEKVGVKEVKSQTGDDLQQTRYITSKILKIVSGQEKIHRDAILKTSAYVELLMQTLKNCCDRTVVVNILNATNELLGKTQVGKRVGTFVHANATNIVFHTMVHETEDLTPAEDMLLLCHQILGKLGQKDRKFALKARLNRALLLYLLFFFLTCVNSSYLGKHNAINPICKVVLQCSRKHVNVLKLALDTLSNLTKSRNNAARTIGGDYVPPLLALYSDWHQADTKYRHVNIRKGILNVLKNITNLRSGRRALVDADGIRILYESAQDVIDCREMESLILLASVIMRKCCPRNKLPLCQVNSAVTFEKPESELYPEISDNNVGNGQLGEEGQDSDNSSLDDDDIDSDDERFKTDNTEETEDYDGGIAPEAFKRTADDLRSYDSFFPELYEIEIQEELSTLESIVIPTASFSSAQDKTREEKLCRQGGHREIHKSATVPLSLYRMQTVSDYSSDNSIYSAARSSSFRPSSFVTEYLDSFASVRSETASAINVKTGASVISLDFQTVQYNQSANSRKPATAKSSKKAKGSKKTQKDKKPRKMKVDLNPEPLFTDALCITPIPVIRDSEEEVEIPTASGDDWEEDSIDESYNPLIYQEMARKTRSIYKFEKIAYPDLIGARGPYEMEPFYHRKFGVQRTKVFEDIDRMIHPEHVIDRDVYNLDTIKACQGMLYKADNSGISNSDEFRVGATGRYESGLDCLRFTGQFESGNLRKVIRVRDFEYDLILNPDINTNHHHQWFYFEVSNMIADTPYRFNIVNCEKQNSQFNFGMKPVMFSVMESMQGRPYWVRVGSDICYYKNHFTRSPLVTGGVKGKTYYTTTFTVTFKHSRDVCYLAYHYPYTYSMLQTHLQLHQSNHDPSQIFFRKQILCHTMSGNPVPVLTITAKPKSNSREHVEELRSRPYIFLSARVHPGESNSSWIMKGTIDFLMSKKPVAQLLREMYIIKIVPMLNPDGVINGNHRSSLAAEDLNRRWDNPCPKLHPTIYHSKGLLQYLQLINKTPLVYCDYHGHSRRKNIFLYGCCPSQSWIVPDLNNPNCTGNKSEDNGYKVLPRTLEVLAPAFSLQNCSFLVEKAKETTARVVVWRQIGVVRSYTMESTYCGIDKESKYKDNHISTRMLEEMGQRFCEGLLRLGRGRVAMPSLLESDTNLQIGATAQDTDLNLDVLVEEEDNDLLELEVEEERDFCSDVLNEEEDVDSEEDYPEDDDDEENDNDTEAM
ncbi:hypothetical protein ACJMK2_042966 [Sinanodonta woodiana]|uniref:tubulin-glutamate carboxypeptidase n=1 Tax=Sinanodonta woodiana TaxID=1069815 RepID=A0ABD3VVZ9_SINWO